MAPGQNVLILYETDKSKPKYHIIIQKEEYKKLKCSENSYYDYKNSRSAPNVKPDYHRT